MRSEGSPMHSEGSSMLSEERLMRSEKIDSLGHESTFCNNSVTYSRLPSLLRQDRMHGYPHGR